MLEANQKEDVHDGPEQPRGPSGEPRMCGLVDRRVPSDDCRIPAATVDERRDLGAADEPIAERFSEMHALLLGNLRQTWKGLALGVEAERHVPKREDLRPPHDSEIGLDRHPAQPIRGDAEALAEGRSRHPGGPNDQAHRQALPRDPENSRTDMVDDTSGPHVNAELHQPPMRIGGKPLVEARKQPRSGPAFPGRGSGRSQAAKSVTKASLPEPWRRC
jgi:hypothetical protein